MFGKSKVLSEIKFTVPAKPQYVQDVKQKITEICKDNNFSYKDMNNLLVVMDEVCANIVKHAYKDIEGDMDFEIQVLKNGLRITVIDHGKSFNWKAFRTPNLNHYVDIGKKGGLGLWIIRKLTDKSDYVVTERGNEMTLVKYHSKPSLMNRALNLIASSKGIKEKFALATTFFILVLMGGIFGYFYMNDQDMLEKKMLISSSEQAMSIGQSSVDKMIKSNYLSIIKMVNDVKANNSNLSEILVIDSSKKIIASSDFEKLHTQFEFKDKVIGGRTIFGVQVLTVGGKSGYGYRLIYPFYFQGMDMGEVHLIIPAASVKAVRAGNKMDILIVTLIVFLIAAVGIYLLLGLIIKPLMALKDGVVAIGEGRLDHRIELDGADEFSEIARAFNDMALKFKGAQVSLIEQEKVQKEIAVAKEIQYTLLPKNIPETEGFDIGSLYRAAREVGGDYYDVMNVAQNTIGVMVADVSGKGVPGSLVMTITRTAVRLIAQKNKSAKSVLVKVNNFVKEDMKKGMFVTAFYLVLDSMTRRINFACAGHDPLLLYRAKENKIYWIKPKGFPLGISLPDDDLFRSVMVEENIKLQKDDMLVVYTDGVTEAMNGKREQYGEQRFVEFVKTNGKSTARDFIAKLDDELKEFTQGYPQNDDITIVAVKEKKTESMVLNKIARDIKKLRDKGMKSKDIEKKLGISIDEFNRVRAQKEDRGNKKEVIRFMAFEQKKDLMKFILDDPEAMPGDYVDRLNEKYKTMIDVKLVESELKRIRLLTVKARILYAAERKR